MLQRAPWRVQRWWVALSGVMGVSFGLRVFFNRHRVLLADRVNFQGADSWYHVRLIENLVHNFPHWLAVDPYALSGGQRVAVAPFFNLVVATVAWAIGLGSPSQHTIEVVAALIPPVLAALVTVPVYLIGAHVFGRRAGLMAAALLAIMPGPFLDRTTFGYVDHHGMEVLLAALVIWALMTRRSRGIRAGILLGCYLLTWTSGTFLVGVLGLWLLIQSLLGYLNAEPIDINFLDIFVSAGIALVLVVLLQDHQMFRFGSQVAAVSALAGLSAMMEALHRQWPPSPRTRWLVPGVAAAGAVAAFAVFVFALPSVSRVVLGDLRRFTPGIAGQTVTEAVPLFYVLGGQFSLAAAYVLFRTAFFVGVIALLPLTRRVWRDRNPSLTLLWTWSAVTFAATLSQNRFGYYLQMNLALLSGWLCDAALSWATAPRVAPPKAKAKKIPRGQTKPQAEIAGPSRFRPAVVSLAIVVLLFVPSLLQATRVVRVDSGVPDPWYSAMTWLRLNSAEPFGTPDRYLAREPEGGADRSPAYSVMSWWDFGYRITAIAHRVPVANPTQEGSEEAARFFSATSAHDADAIMDASRSRYVVADDSLPLILHYADGSMSGSFASLLAWARVPASGFYDLYYEPSQAGGLTPVLLFYPEYFQTMAHRLFVHAGQAAMPRDSTYVISYAERRSPSGQMYRHILSARRFAAFAEGNAYLATLGPGLHRIVSRDPMSTPVPLEALPRYHLLHEEFAAGRPEQGLPVVRLFGYR
jgi:oligosaccharyl transferase (archaeosortase A-associated)